MPCITYVLKSEEVKEQFIPYGGTTYSFCYVLNLTDDMFCSEFGDCFFENKGSCLKRIS